MQTLNVGAGRTDQEYEASEKQRRADLRDESRSAANYFFWAAGLAALGTGLAPVRLGFLVNIGAFDLLSFYGRPMGPLYPLAMYSAAAAWLIALVTLGIAGRGGYRWAFFAGMVLYGADMLILIAMFSLWAFGVHAFFLFRWFQGQKALKDLNEAGVSRP
jgi:cation transport ATPase